MTKDPKSTALTGLAERVALTERTKRVWQWTLDSRPNQTIQRYLAERGPMLAAGMTYHALFSLFAALWLGFSMLGWFLSSDDQRWHAITHFIAEQIPGLINTGSGGLISADDLGAATLHPGWSSVIAVLVLLWTSSGWMKASQHGVRAMFTLGRPLERKLLLNQAIYVASSVMMAILILVSSLVAAFMSSMTNWVFKELGWDNVRFISATLARVAAAGVSVGLDFMIFLLLVRLAAGVKIPWRSLWPGALLGALAITGLKFLGTAVISGPTTNPLITSFIVLLVLMIWFNVVSQASLIAIAWIAVGVERQSPDKTPEELFLGVDAKAATAPATATQATATQAAATQAQAKEQE